jgi:hypothetical protein
MESGANYMPAVIDPQGSLRSLCCLCIISSPKLGLSRMMDAGSGKLQARSVRSGKIAGNMGVR